MKSLLISALVFFSTASFGADFHRAAICSAPEFFARELVVYFNSSFTAARVELLDAVTYETRVISAGGPVATLIFNTDFDSDFDYKMILAVDGQNELHKFNQSTQKFEWASDMTCK